MKITKTTWDNLIKIKVIPLIKKYATVANARELWANHRLPTISVFGLLFGLVFTLFFGRNTQTPSNQLALPASSPYEHNISGVGFVEANSKNISVNAFSPGIVSEIFVTEGDSVTEGDPLFLIDDRTARAEVMLREREEEAANANLKATQVTLAEAIDSLDRAKGLKAGYSISQEELVKREFAVQKAKAQVKLYESQLHQAEAQLELARITLEKLMVIAPVSGLIMKVAICPGEYVSQVPNTAAPILMGNDDPLYIRVQFDENDVWRLKEDAKAHAYLKSNQSINFPLKLIRVEPYATPKRKIGGDSSELIDTRIIEVLFLISAKPKNLYIGQQLDVFIEADEGP